MYVCMYVYIPTLASVLFCREALKIIIQRSSTADNLEHRLMWSPHVPLPDEDEDEQEICNIVLTHGSDVSLENAILGFFSAGGRCPGHYATSPFPITFA